MWKKVGIVGGTTAGRICVAFVLMQLGSGCVIDDFADGGDKFANGCERSTDPVPSSPFINVDVPGPGRCVTVKIDVPVDFKVSESGASCRLRGGNSNGDVGTPEPTNPIEVKTGHKGEPLSSTEVFDIATDGDLAVIPFYCEEDAGIAGAIFVTP